MQDNKLVHQAAPTVSHVLHRVVPHHKRPLPSAPSLIISICSTCKRAGAGAGACSQQGTTGDALSRLQAYQEALAALPPIFKPPTEKVRACMRTGDEVQMLGNQSHSSIARLAATVCSQHRRSSVILMTLFYLLGMFCMTQALSSI
jgi:hypothetical protein